MRVDPSRGRVLIDARRRCEHEPLRRRNLDNLREFWRALAAGEIPTVRQLLAPDICIVAHGNPAGTMNARGLEDACRYFERLVEAGVNRFEFEMDQLLVDGGGVCTAGRVRIPYPGSILRVLGHDVDDPEAHYVYESRIVMIWSVNEEGKLRKQASYVGGDGFANIAERKLLPASLVSAEGG